MYIKFHSYISEDNEKMNKTSVPMRMAFLQGLTNNYLAQFDRYQACEFWNGPCLWSYTFYLLNTKMDRDRDFLPGQSIKSFG